MLLTLTQYSEKTGIPYRTLKDYVDSGKIYSQKVAKYSVIDSETVLPNYKPKPRKNKRDK